jgi:hypothetical protein
MSDTYGETVKGMLADAAGALKRDSAPTCPFCGAACKPLWPGSSKVFWFECGTMLPEHDRTDRHDQTSQCAQAERDRMAKELEKWREDYRNLKDQHAALADLHRELGKKFAAAQERIRRLEEAADLFLERMAAHISQCGWCNGSQRDNDGENEINKPCPKCGQAWADLGSFAKEAKEAKEAKA